MATIIGMDNKEFDSEDFCTYYMTNHREDGVYVIGQKTNMVDYVDIMCYKHPIDEDVDFVGKYTEFCEWLKVKDVDFKR
jgi:hypothetical protein